MKFIYLCAAILIFSFTALPVLNGVSKERNAILASNTETETTPIDNSLSFAEMYALAAQDENFDLSSLNAITPASGQDVDVFPSGFSGISDTALTDAPVPITEEEIKN